MNLRCKVCGEKAAGFHFGAFTCEGCKSFFGRCCNNMSVIGECRNNKECVIDKKNRTSCKACRLQKCLMVGMSKSGSRYGRRSNWFKQYFQETEIRSKHRTTLLAAAAAAAAAATISGSNLTTTITTTNTTNSTPSTCATSNIATTIVSAASSPSSVDDLAAVGGAVNCDYFSTKSENYESLVADTDVVNADTDAPLTGDPLSRNPFCAFAPGYRRPAKRTTVAAEVASAAIDGAAGNAFANLSRMPVSSRLYLNCFPHLSLERLVAYTQDAKFFGASCGGLPLTMVPSERIHRYWDKLFAARSHAPLSYVADDANQRLANGDDDDDDDDDNDDDDNDDYDNPLDLSAHSRTEDQFGVKRTVPLDLSVK